MKGVILVYAMPVIVCIVVLSVLDAVFPGFTGRHGYVTLGIIALALVGTIEAIDRIPRR